jgi:hypothetical protein
MISGAIVVKKFCAFSRLTRSSERAIIGTLNIGELPCIWVDEVEFRVELDAICAMFNA